MLSNIMPPPANLGLKNLAMMSGANSNLKLIANYGAGYDHIDIKTALQRGIIVTNTPSVLTTDTADMTMALILAIPRKLREGHEEMQSGNWKGWSPSAMIGVDMEPLLIPITLYCSYCSFNFPCIRTRRVCYGY